MSPDAFIANHPLPVIGAVLLAAAICAPAAALSPPAPPPPTIAEIVEGSQVVFIGRVESIVWQPIIPDATDAGGIALKVRVTERLLGNTREVPMRIIYIAGSASMSEAQAKARYEKHSFVFFGHIFHRPDGEARVMFPPSGKRPYELSTVSDFKREITRLNGIAGTQGSRPGTR